MKKKYPFFTKDKRSLFFICIAASILIHFCVIILLSDRKTPNEVKKRYLSQHNLGQENKNHYLDEALQEIVVAPSPVLVPFDIEYQPKEILGQKTTEEIAKIFPSETMGDFNSKEVPLGISPLSPGDLQTSDLSFNESELTKGSSVDLKNEKAAKDIPVELNLPDPERKELAMSQVAPSDIDARLEMKNKVKEPEKTIVETPDKKYESLIALYSNKKEPLYFPKSHPSQYAKPTKKNATSPLSSDLTDYNLYENLSIFEKDDFILDVKIMPDQEGTGVVFAATLIPDKKETAALKQNFYFLIDRSNSVEKQYFNTFKRAVVRALSVVDPSNNFNIIICDKKIVKFSETSLPATEKNIKLAKLFLDKQEHGSYFSAADIYASLEDLLPEKTPKGEVITAILLSDGESSLTTKKQKTAFSSWIKKNEGKVSLYTAAAGTKNNLLLLDLISRTSRGRLTYSDTLTSFPRKLTKLVSTLIHPIARDVVATTIETEENARITLFSDSYHLQNLYAGEPLTIMGRVDSPRDFTLLIQAQDKERPFTIKKRISLQQTNPVKNLKQAYASEQAYLCYKKFLVGGDQSHLKQAKDLFKEAKSYIAGD